jgi:hypothetical protein
MSVTHNLNNKKTRDEKCVAQLPEYSDFVSL